MSNQPQDDELMPEQTEGFKIGEKKTIDEYKQLGEGVSFLFCFQAVHCLPELESSRP